jgi:DNA invertase Pin-like site-specific DNA recombinase
LNRPALARLQKDVFGGKVKTIIVWKLDRLSRRLLDGINLLAAWCEKGVKVVILTRQIELSGAVGRMIAALLLGLAEIELEYRTERQEAGIAVAEGKSKYRGRKAGTTKGKPARARELRSSGLTIAEVCQAMGISKATAIRYIKAA